MATALPLVMIWRRVDSLHRAAVTTERVFGMPLIGKDEYSVMYDGGGTILGLWTQDQRALLATPQCSELNFATYPLVSNPTSELVLVAPDLPDSVVRLSGASSVFFTAPAERPDGRVVSVYDDGGNLSTILEPSQNRLRSDAGRKLTDLLSVRGLRRRANGTASGIVGYKLLSADLQGATEFYTGVLGLEAIERTDRSVDLDAGSVILSLEQEPSAGLVRGVARTGRLQGDWLVFLVDDIGRSTEEFGRERGVRFPQGIEASDIGQMAYFEDPDGHALVLWQPSGKPTAAQPIDFYPALDRIKREVAQ